MHIQPGDAHFVALEYAAALLHVVRAQAFWMSDPELAAPQRLNLPVRLAWDGCAIADV
jgi:hypothetical protein